MHVDLVTLYQYDSLGTLAANKISNESFTVVPPGRITDVSYHIPRAAPFYADSVVIKDGRGPGARVLIQDVDYRLVLDFISASAALRKRICAGVAIINPSYTGTLYMDYQTLGGQYSLADTSILEELVRNRYTIHHISFEQLINLPAAFAPDWHDHQLNDIKKMEQLIIKLQEIKEAIAGRNGSFDQIKITLDHHLGPNGGHTAAQVGLSNVRNYGVATLEELRQATANKYVTADVLFSYITEIRNGLSQGMVTSGAVDEKLNQALRGLNNTYATDSDVDRKIRELRNELSTSFNSSIRNTNENFGNYVTKQSLTTTLNPYALKTSVTELDRKIEELKRSLTGLASGSDTQNAAATAANALSIANTAKSDLDKLSKKVEAYISTNDGAIRELRNSLQTATDNINNLTNKLNTFSKFNIVNVTSNKTLTAQEMARNTIVRVNSSNAVTVTIPANSNMVVGETIHIRQVGQGDVTIAGASGVTVLPADSRTLRRDGSSATLVCVATNTYDLVGEIK